MARYYVTIGSTPCDEPCIGVGSPRHSFSRLETQIYCRQLEREYPAGTFRVKGFRHDFGTYYEVVAWYDDEGQNKEECDAAFQAEGGGRGTWDEQSLKELREQLGDWYFTEIRK